jgi:D-glycero-D-manno-heptose 1,7-bisphosphate phosphatase
MKAVFLDRDGVINELVYYPEQGIIDSPCTASQFRLLPGVGQAIKKAHEMGYRVVVVSNQPGIAKGSITEAVFDQIRVKMKDELAFEGVSLDAEYYCQHHPQARVAKYKVECNCRKPLPGLLLQAAVELGLDSASSWMVGDGITDIQAGRAAGCKTILIGRPKCETCKLMDDKDARADAVCADLMEAMATIGART